jgi:hypothetical protein
MIQTIVTMKRTIVTLRNQQMFQALNLPRAAPRGSSALSAIFLLIGPALRVAKAYEKRSPAANADLRALGIEPTTFNRFLSARRDFDTLD